ncbi:hypothetical protein GDO81_022390, partial [Engystomops pustulosus]
METIVSRLCIRAVYVAEPGKAGWMLVPAHCMSNPPMSPQARQQAQIRHQMADDSKGDYSSVLQKFNHEQQEHYHTHIPAIFQKLQDMEERRISRLGESLKTYAEIDRQVIPIIGKCLDGITKSAESINGKQ